MKESDLYPPTKAYLERQGYNVKGEVNHCDLVAKRGDELVIVELKLSLNLNSVLQAVDRLSLSDAVYIGVPASGANLKKQRKRIIKLMKMLGLGLIAIDPSNKKMPVAILVDPGNYQPRPNRKRQTRLLAEFEHRVGDPNIGGSSTARGVTTVYRQQAIGIAHHLSIHGPTKAATVAEATGHKKARDILYRNVYGWFDRQGGGVYQLSPRGQTELETWSLHSKP